MKALKSSILSFILCLSFSIGVLEKASAQSLGETRRACAKIYEDAAEEHNKAVQQIISLRKSGGTLDLINNLYSQCRGFANTYKR